MDLIVDVLLAQKISLCCSIHVSVLRIRTSALPAASVAARPVRHHHPVGCRCYLAPSSRVPSGTTIYRGVRVVAPLFCSTSSSIRSAVTSLVTRRPSICSKERWRERSSTMHLRIRWGERLRAGSLAYGGEERRSRVEGRRRSSSSSRGHCEQPSPPPPGGV